MKTQIKRFSKSALAVVLTLCMLVSCMTVGIIATDAAKTADERVGATTYYFRGSSNSWGSTALTSLGDGYYYYANQVASGVTFKITDNTSWSGGEWNKDNIENSLGDVTNLTADGSNVKTAASCYIMFNPTQNKIWAVKNEPTSAAYYKQMAQVKYGAGTAHEMKYGRVFFDNTTSNWSVNKVYLVVGHGSYVKAYAMNALTNTKLYGYALNDSNGFGDAKYIAFVGTNSTGISSTYTGSAQNKTFTELLKDNRSNITYSSQLFTDTSPALNNSNNTYPFTSGSAGDSCSLTGTWSSNTPNTYFNKTQTINIYTNKASSSAGGSVTKSGYAVSSTAPYTSSTSTTGTAPALTSTYTLRASAKDGYTFDGWYSDSTCTTKLSSNTTYSYTVTGTRTIYANFTQEAVTYDNISANAKYSTDGSSFSTNMPSGANPTVSANSYTTGSSALTLSASAVDGYTFYKWVGTNGTIGGTETSLTNATFTPTASGATATAQYKKNYTITSSVDDTGTGAGTVTTSKTSVEAGGSYTITATAKSGSAIESVKVNGTAKTATASQTISSVSADQTVVVKFKSNVYLRGGSTIGTNWTTGDAMTSNAAGTEFTKTYSNVAGSSSGTQYQFKLYVNGYNNDGTATINITGGASTGTCTHQSSGDQNYVLTLKKAANVTVKSNGTKITEIKVVPVNATKYAVTFKKADNTTITGQYEGTNFSTASADATVQVYAGDEISYKVEAADEYYIKSLEGVSGFTANTTYNGTLTVNAATTVTPTAAQLLSITAKSNKSDRGTVQVDAEKGKAYPGQIVKVTVTPKNGVLKSLTVKDASGTNVELRDSAQTSSLNYSQLDVATVTALMYDFFNKSGEALGATANDEALSADTVQYFTMPDSSVTVSATFDSYSAEANYYYSGYDTGGNIVNGYDTKRLTESIFDGEKFAYYHVEGRTDVDQLFTIFTKADQQGYVYFTQPSAYGYWSKNQAPKAYFWNDNGTVGTAWPGASMTYHDKDNNQNRYRIRIPDGATHVKFSDGSSSTTNQVTHDITLQTGIGGYYLGNNAWNNDAYTATSYTVNNSDPQGLQNGTVYYNYSDNAVFKTGELGFTKTWSNHNVNQKSYAKPNEDMSNKDYYIIVLYPGKTYKVGDKTYTVGNTYPAIFWSAESPVEEESVKVYAKDGSIRSDSKGSTYANIADTKIYDANGTTSVGTKVSGNITNQTYETYKVDKGETIVIKTQIGATDTGNLTNAAALKAKYYVRGFCVNGEVSELLEWNANGLYTLTYKVPENYEGKNIEITPIYYLKDTTANPIVTYRVTGFTDELKAVGSGKPGWGDTLYTYPFYGKLGGQNNAFGAYPGQPMVYYKGQYQMQIPQKSTAWDIYYDDSALSGYSGNPAKANAVANTPVSGVTMSNGYWDIIHRQIMGYGDNSKSADHVQTYDYGDFYKIFNEKKPVDNIVFDFKYRTAKHNLTDIITTNTTASALNTKYGTDGNGFELLTNFHGRNVDLFGTPLSGDAADPTKTTPVYVVSTGGVIDNQSGVENIAGYYATEWVVYGNTSGTTYQRITGGGKNSIPPEVLVLNDDDTTSFNTTTYPSAVNTTAKPYKITDWKALYTALEAYRGKPVYISYEAADAQQGQEMYYTGTGGATRNDGRWLYSKNGENITSNIKIQYSDDNGVTYTDLNTTTPQVNGLSAYFTNDGVEGEMTYSTTIDPDKTFDFEAKTTNANYKFVGWFMEDGTKITTDNASHTERSGSYTFVAKFMKVESGQLILSHSVDTNDTYKGAGTAKISAVVKDGDEVVRTYDLSTSDITLDDKIIKSDSDYTIEVTLEATATGQDTLGTTVLANPSGQVSTYFNPASTTTEGKTKTIVLNSFTVKSLFSETTQSVKNIIYHSYFNQVKFHYQVTFQYKDRFGETKNYTRQGYLTTAQVANENYVDTSSSTKKLLPAFIQTIAPHVSNFGETITWNFDTSGYAFAVSGNDYNVTATILASQTKTEKRNITFKLPYKHNDGIAELNGNVGTAATTTNFELTGDRAVDYKAVPVLPNNGVNGIYTNDKFKNWIAAPAVIDNNGTQEYFQYWSIASTSAEDREIERCYFNAFNYAALDNFVVTPIYGDKKTDISQSGIYTGVTYLETSRNQWNDNQERAKTERDKAADLLYNDFVINFNYKGAQLNLDGTDSAAVKDLGVVVERIQELDIKQDGTKDTDISKYTGIAKDENTVKNIINESITDKRYSKHSIAKKDLDNKNSYMLYDAFYNGAGWNLENQKSAQSYTYKNYVYRVYTYIKYTDENGKAQIVLSEVPGYFTMYDEAVKDYVAPKTSSTNP